MLSFNIEKKNCSGCTACYSVCPKQCISMIRDDEGFDYPVLTSPEICIDCKLCEKVCPANKVFPVKVEQKAYAALSKDYAIWHRSASGGHSLKFVRHGVMIKLLLWVLHGTAFMCITLVS